jgi:hypothetical protein
MQSVTRLVNEKVEILEPHEIVWIKKALAISRCKKLWDFYMEG